MNNCLDHIDFEALALITRSYTRAARKRWQLLDTLYSRRAYEEQELARCLHKAGRLDDRGLERAWAEIDERMGAYDARCMERRELEKYLWNLEQALREITRKIEDESHVA